MLKCIPKTQGGKGNEGKFIERGSKLIVAAGKVSAQPNLHVAENLKHYLFQEEVDALISDAIIPEPKKQTSSSRSIKKHNIAELINPPVKTKIESLVDEMKETCYSSYWKKPLGTTHDQAPLLPPGFDIHKSTFGRKTVFSESVYNLIMPRDTPLGKNSPALDPGYQLDRKYCIPPYDPNQIFGIIYRPERSGIYAKRCFTEDRVNSGNAFCGRRNAREADIKTETVAPIGQSMTPNDNIKRVPAGYAFGKLKSSCDTVPNCLSSCGINSSGREFFLKCLCHLNSLRKYLFKLFDHQFFRQFHLYFKYLDKAKTGWLPKDVIYKYCSTKNVRVNPTLIEPLLEMWNGFDGSKIQYGIFVDTIDPRKPSPGIPKIPDVAVECIEYSTTYNDMVKPGQDVGSRRIAGLPSARYFDKDEVRTPVGLCKADHINLPEESDVRSCVSPSSFTHFGVTYRDMYAKRSPEVVRRVFEAAGEKFNEEKFNELWDEAKKYHSQGWVSFATFRKALDNIL